MTFLNWATIAAVACPLGIVDIVVAGVLILASKADDGPLRSDDPTPFEDESTGEIPIVVDPPVDRAYLPQVPDGMVLYRGGAVHPECAERWLRFDLTPVDGCAVWLTDSLKETVT